MNLYVDLVQRKNWWEISQERWEISHRSEKKKDSFGICSNNC
jgi:hypothetical protein